MFSAINTGGLTRDFPRGDDLAVYEHGVRAAGSFASRVLEKEINVEEQGQCEPRHHENHNGPGLARLTTVACRNAINCEQEKWDQHECDLERYSDQSSFPHSGYRRSYSARMTPAVTPQI